MKLSFRQIPQKYLIGVVSALFLFVCVGYALSVSSFSRGLENIHVESSASEVEENLGAPDSKSALHFFMDSNESVAYHYERGLRKIDIAFACDKSGKPVFVREIDIRDRGIVDFSPYPPGLVQDFMFAENLYGEQKKVRLYGIAIAFLLASCLVSTFFAFRGVRHWKENSIGNRWLTVALLMLSLYLWSVCIIPLCVLLVRS